MDRQRFLRLTLAVLSTQLTSSLCAQGLGDGVLRVGVLAHYKPFSFIDGQLQGFDVDVLNRLAAIMKLQLKFHVDGMANLQKKLQSDEISVIGNQLLPTPENRRLFDFAKPYASNQLVCVQHEDDPRDFLSLDDLFGKKLGVLAHTGVEEQARGVIGKTVVPFPTIDQALKQLAEKKLDAVLEESLIADFYIERDGLPVKVTSWLCLAENMPSGTAQRPDDVIKIRNGKTVEVLNTDAEGRLVLADGLSAAAEAKPDLIVDVATLTGAATIALGTRYAGLMGDDEAIKLIKDSAESSGELVWHMPLPIELRALLNSDVADIANVKIGNRAGGMLIGGHFLREFVPSDIKWAHLAVAGPADNGGSAYGYTPKGGTGVIVRTLVSLAAKLSGEK